MGYTLKVFAAMLTSALMGMALAASDASFVSHCLKILKNHRNFCWKKCGAKR